MTVAARVATLGPAIEAAADETAAQRRLPGALIEAMRETGVFGMPMPRAWGGPELEPLEQIRILADLAYHDPAVGWVAMICCDGGYYSGFLADDAVARELYPSLDLLTSGWLSPVGKAVVEGDHYRVSGRWQFGSGILHADRIVGGCVVVRDGELVTGDDGRPEFVVAFLPIEDVTVHDVWHTTGLAGTGSNDYSVDGVLVPREHSFSPLRLGYRPGPLYRYHGWFFTKLMGVAIGAARRALDELIELAETKVAPPTFRPIKHEYRVQVALGEARASIDAAEALAERTLEGMWRTLGAGDRPTLHQRADVGAAGIWVTRTCKKAVDALCEKAGTSSIFAANRLEGLRRDLTVMCHHLAAQHKTYQVVGQMRLGIEPSFAIF